jgi:hypothetical protein
MRITKVLKVDLRRSKQKRQGGLMRRDRRYTKWKSQGSRLNRGTLFRYMAIVLFMTLILGLAMS